MYSVRDLAALPVRECGASFALDDTQPLPSGVSASGLTEQFPSVSRFLIYGATKLASEIMAVEYGATFGFPVWLDRCGILAGAGQFGTAEQGIFLTGFMRMPRGVACAISVSARAACRSEMRFIRTTSRCSLRNKCGAIPLPNRFITWAGGLRIRFHWPN